MSKWYTLSTGEVISVDPNSIKGGQIWTQLRFPFKVRYTTLGEGSILCTTHSSGEELAKYLHEKGYTCEGRLSDLLLEERYGSEDIRSGRGAGEKAAKIKT
jgi:hypothetical protein